MVQKKRFILQVPYFLATKAGSLHIKLMFAACYMLLCLSYFIPLVGTLVATAAILVFWQFFEISTKKSAKYKVYSSFLLQRLLFCNIFTLALFMYCSNNVIFNQYMWQASTLFLIILNCTDVYFTVKGFTGVAYINGKKSI